MATGTSTGERAFSPRPSRYSRTINAAAFTHGASYLLCTPYPTVAGGEDPIQAGFEVRPGDNKSIIVQLKHPPQEVSVGAKADAKTAPGFISRVSPVARSFTAMDESLALPRNCSTVVWVKTCMSVRPATLS